MSIRPEMDTDLFVTCVVDQLYPEVGVSVVRLLRRLGVKVGFPKDQTCCGQAVFNSGFTREAALLARRVLKSFNAGQEGSSGKYVVVPSGSCATMMRIFYAQLFQDDPELRKQAEELAGRVYELSEFLVKVLGVTDVGARFAGPRGDNKVTYHPSCHLLRELEVSREPRELVRNVQGAELVEMPEAETCCGFGGTFSVKYPHISIGMLEDKIRNIINTGASTLVACDMSCLMHIGGALSRQGINVRPMHLAQLLEP
jgi:L-lactate dehydrogenase complex protein LldE